MKKTLLAIGLLFAMLFQTVALAVDVDAIEAYEWIEISGEYTELPDNNELFSGYVQQEIDKSIYGEISTFGTAAGDNLLERSEERRLYEFLKEEISKIADGTNASTYFTFDTKMIDFAWSKEELGLESLMDNGMVLEEATNALDIKIYGIINDSLNSVLLDCPYEAYWFDKNSGYGWGYDPRYDEDFVVVQTIRFRFCVSEDYMIDSNSSNALYTADLNKTQATANAVINAKAIVEKHKDKSDLEKLTSYKDEICQLVSYDYEEIENNAPYGNPWQLINVFDEDDTTNVVCEETYYE